MTRAKKADPSSIQFGRAVIGAVGDLHVGSMSGLCPPTGIKRDGGGVYLPNKSQEWMWGRWLSLWDTFYRTDPEQPHIVVVNAEFIDGNHHGTTEIATPDPGEMIEAALEVMKPAMRKNATLLVTRGTEAHSGKAGGIDNAIAKALGAVANDETGSHAEQHLYFETCGVLFDVAHHVGGSRVPHTRGNGIRADVIQAMVDAVESKERAPDVIIRSHVHTLQDTGCNYPLYGVVLPAWQLKTAFAHRVTRSKVQYVGGLICELSEGTYQTRILKWMAPTPKLYRI